MNRILRAFACVFLISISFSKAASANEFIHAARPDEKENPPDLTTKEVMAHRKAALETAQKAPAVSALGAELDAILKGIGKKSFDGFSRAQPGIAKLLVKAGQKKTTEAEIDSVNDAQADLRAQVEAALKNSRGLSIENELRPGILVEKDLPRVNTRTEFHVTKNKKNYIVSLSAGSGISIMEVKNFLDIQPILSTELPTTKGSTQKAGLSLKANFGEGGNQQIRLHFDPGGGNLPVSEPLYAGTNLFLRAYVPGFSVTAGNLTPREIEASQTRRSTVLER